MKPGARFSVWGGIAVSFCSYLALSAHAAAAQTAPPSLPTREEVEPPVEGREAEPARVRIDSSAAIAPDTCPLRNYDIQVQIRSLNFSGVSGQPLPPEITRLLAQVQPPAEGASEIKVVCDLRDQATSILRNAGYVASVQIPPQTIDDGELSLNVITARIVEVRVRGDAPPYRGTVEARTEQLKALDPLNERDAERILLTAGDVPGLDVQLSLRPAGTAPGEVIGELAVAYRPYSVVANINNLGSRQLGRESAYVRGEVYGLTGASDVTYLGASSTFDFEEQRVLQVGHLTGIGNRGVHLEGSFLYAWSRPDVGALDLRSESMIAGLALTAPLVRTRRQNISLTGGMELIEQRTRVHGSGGSSPLNRDKLRVGFVRSEGEFRDFTATGEEAYWLRGSLELRKGFDIFGATEPGTIVDGYTPSRFNGDPTAFVVRGELDAVAPLVSIFSVATRVRGQWTDDPLLNFEEFSIGNLTVGRGYDPGANSADRAIGIQGELRARLYQDAQKRIEAFAFYDSVWIWNLDPNAIEDDRRLGSFGGGIRTLVSGIGAFEITYAEPEHRALLVPGARRSPKRLLLSLTFQFPAGGR